MAKNGVITSCYCLLLQITVYYCSILSIEIIIACQCSLQQITAQYCYCCPLLLVTSLTSFITSLTTHYCHISCQIHGSNGFITTPSLPNRQPLLHHSFHYYPLLPYFAVVMAPLLHHYYLITPQLCYASYGCPLLPITSTISTFLP